MARIVSGAVPQDTNFALLQGMEVGRQYAAARDAKRQQQLQEAQLLFRIQQALQEQAKETAAQDAQGQSIANKATFLAQRAEAGLMHPGEKMLQRVIGARARIKDPKALSMFDKAVKGLSTAHKKTQQRNAAQEAIQSAATDGLIDEVGAQEYSRRFESGEEPETLTKELGKLRQDRTIANQATQHSAEVIAEAQNLVKAAPAGSNQRLEAEYLLQEFADSPSRQAKPGEAEEMRRKVQMALLLTPAEREALEKEKREQRRRMFTEAPMPGLGGMSGAGMREELEKEPGFFGGGGPEIPAGELPGTHATRKRGKVGPVKARSLDPGRTQQVIVSLAEEASDALDLAKRMQAQGLPLNAETQALAKAALQARRTAIASVAGADR